jgi:hypothetical protein
MMLWCLIFGSFVWWQVSFACARDYWLWSQDTTKYSTTVRFLVPVVIGLFGPFAVLSFCVFYW